MRVSTLFCVSLLIGLFVLCSRGNLSAQDAASAEVVAQEAASMKADLEAKIQAMLDAPAGVFDPEYDNGQLMRLKIKGESEVSKALSGARADRQARDKAERDAKAAFSQFLNEQVTVVESDTEGFVIQEKSGEESAEYLNASQTTMTSLSSSFLRGLIVIFDHVEGEGANRKYVVVLGWSKKLVDAAANAQATMNRSRADEGQAQSTQQAAPAGTAETKSNTSTQTRTGDLDGF